MSFIRDTLLVFRRQERLALRQPAWVIIGLMQPILYLALFGPLLKGLPGASLGGGGNAYRFFVPGLLIQLALFGSTFVGLRHHLGLAGRRDRAVPGHPGEQARHHGRPGACGT